MTLEDARHIALAFSGTTEEPHFDRTSFRVKGKIFATAPPEGEVLHVMLDEHEVRAAVAEAPGTCAELWWGKRLSGVRVTLAGADPQLVAKLLADAWRRKAPRARREAL